MDPISFVNIGRKSPDSLIGDFLAGPRSGRIVGWARTNTAPNGQRYIGFGIYHTEVALKLDTGQRAYVTVVSEGKF